MGLKLTNETSDSPVLYLYGDIGADFGGVTAAEFRSAINSLDPKSALELHIFSEGGSFHDGIAMHAAIRQRVGVTNIIVDGLAASAASLPAMAGATIEMAQGSWLMIHEVRGSAAFMTADDMRKAAVQMDTINDQLVGIYMPRWSGSEAELRSALKSETWLSESQAVEAGLADTVTDSMAMAACVRPERFHFTNVPKPLLESTQKEAARERMKAVGSVVDDLFAEQDLIRGKEDGVQV